MSVVRRGSEEMKRLRLFASIMALCLPSAAYSQPLPNEPHIYVEGAAEIDVEPDRLVVKVLVSSVDTSASVAKSDVDERSRRLIDMARGLQIDEADISATTLMLSPSYEWTNQKREFEGTRVARRIEIVLGDLSRYSELMQAIMSAEINEIVSTKLESTSSASVEDQALQAALADATARARLLAESAGGKLGRVYSISEFQLREDYWTLTSGRMTVAGRARGATLPPDVAGFALHSEPAPFAPGLLHAKATVYVVFELER